MARDNVPVTDLVINNKVDRGVGINIVVANGAEVQCDGNTSRLFLEVTNTNGSDRVLTFPVGFGPLAGQGALAITVPAGGDVLICLESARFVQSGVNSGKILLDFAASFAGTIRAFRVPNNC